MMMMMMMIVGSCNDDVVDFVDVVIMTIIMNCSRVYTLCGYRCFPLVTSVADKIA